MKTPTVIIDITGGVVQSAVADGLVQVVVLDYDVDQAPDGYRVWPIPQDNGSKEAAWVCDPVVEQNSARVTELLTACNL